MRYVPKKWGWMAQRGGLTLCSHVTSVTIITPLSIHSFTQPAQSSVLHRHTDTHTHIHTYTQEQPHHHQTQLSSTVPWKIIAQATLWRYEVHVEEREREEKEKLAL
jgi:hypothetical protein